MKKSNVSQKNKYSSPKPRELRYPLPVTTHVPEKWVEEAKYHPEGKSGFLRDAILAYKDYRHVWRFREFLENLSGEILILYKWKEKGHPGGLKWTDKEEEMLTYYERCFEILENSPFNEKIR